MCSWSGAVRKLCKEVMVTSREKTKVFFPLCKLGISALGFLFVLCSRNDRVWEEVWSVVFRKLPRLQSAVAQRGSPALALMQMPWTPTSFLSRNGYFVGGAKRGAWRPDKLYLLFISYVAPQQNRHIQHVNNLEISHFPYNQYLSYTFSRTIPGKKMQLRA